MKDYQAWTVADLHNEVRRRDLAGRSALKTKDDLVAALVADDDARVAARAPEAKAAPQALTGAVQPPEGVEWWQQPGGAPPAE